MAMLPGEHPAPFLNYFASIQRLLGRAQRERLGLSHCKVELDVMGQPHHHKALRSHAGVRGGADGPELLKVHKFFKKMAVSFLRRSLSL